MPVTASQFIKSMGELDLKFSDRGVDRDGDHIFTTGFPTSKYIDFDQKKSIMTTIQLREHVENTGENTEKERKVSELLAAIRNNDKAEIDRLSEEIEFLTKNEGEREYEMVSIYIPKLNDMKLTRSEILKKINEVNARVKCSSLAIDRAGDVVYNYMLIIEDSTFTTNQLRRLFSVMITSVEEFGTLCTDS